MLKRKKYSLFYILIKFVFRRIINPQYNVIYKGLAEVERLEAPYLVLPNHCSFFDPFFINGPLEEKIHYVISDTQLRNPFMKWILGITGVIAISKNRSDLKSLKVMTTAIKEKKVVGIFPEGLRTWDGVTLPVIESTAKLIRMFNVPVVVPLLEGAYLMDPRWGRGFRKGKVIVTYKILFNGEKTGKKSVDEIYKVLSEALEHNEHKSEALKGVEFKSKRLAEGIEQVLYLCPNCHSISSFTSKRDKFTCEKCSMEVEYTTTGTLSYNGTKTYFNTVHQWNTWQKSEIKNSLEGLISVDRDIILSRTGKKSRFKILAKGELHLFKDRLEFVGKDTMIIPFSEISGINVQFKERLEFYFNKELYRLHNKKRVFSARKINDVYDSFMA